MIIDSKIKDVTTEGITNSKKMFINTDNSEHFIRMLTKTYADPIGSLIREAVANAKDSHTMANVDDPVIVYIKQEINNTYSFNVKDQGLGLDELEFSRYIMGIGESTKTKLVNVIGGYGIGSKAASSYQEKGSYFYTCVKNNIKRKFVIFQGESVPEYSKISEEFTEEKNGVIITVPILKYDLQSFETKIKEQLCYFSNVVFLDCNIDNSYKIYREENYQFSEINIDKKLHITLDDVYYPIDFKKLERNEILIPIALRFSLSDGLTPIPNRENLEYNRNTRELINKKIDIVLEELKLKYLKQTSKELDNKEDIIESIENTNNILKLGQNKINLNELNIKNNYKIKDITLISIDELRNIRYKILINYIIVDNFKKCNRRYSENYLELRDLYKKNIFIKSSSFILNNKLKLYLKSLHEPLLIKKENLKLFKAYNNLYKLLNLKNLPKNLWRKKINEFYKIQDLLLADVVKIEDLKIPQSFLDSLKKRSTKTTITKEEISFEILFREGWYKIKKEKKVVNLKDIGNNKKVYLYTNVLGKAKDFIEIFNKINTNFNYCYISTIRDYRKLKETNNKNLINLDDLTYNKVLSKYLSYYYIHKNLDIKLLKRIKDFVYEEVNKDLGIAIDHCINYTKNINMESDFSTFVDAFVKIYETKNYLIPDIVEKINKINSFLKDTEDIHFLFQRDYLLSNDYKKIIKELLKSRNISLMKNSQVIENLIFENDELSVD